MILADTRHRLTRRDAQLAARLIAREDPDELARLEAALADGELDVVLDDPRLPAALLAHHGGAHASLTLFVYVAVRHALLQREVSDRALADYAAAVLLHFGVRGRAERIADSDDEQYDTLVGLLDDVNDPDPRRAFLVRAHLGNYALWLSGMFPDWIEHRRWRRGGPDLGYYESLGRQGFTLAAEHRLAERHGLTPLYEAAAERFDRLRVALNAVSDRMLFPHVHTPERLMRQVTDEARWRR